MGRWGRFLCRIGAHDWSEITDRYPVLPKGRKHIHATVLCGCECERCGRLEIRPPEPPWTVDMSFLNEKTWVKMEDTLYETVHWRDEDYRKAKQNAHTIKFLGHPPQYMTEEDITRVDRMEADRAAWDAAR